MRAELEPLFEMIDDLEIAMMTTRRPDGHLEARYVALVITHAQVA